MLILITAVFSINDIDYDDDTDKKKKISDDGDDVNDYKFWFVDDLISIFWLMFDSTDLFFRMLVNAFSH